ncbi:hypothetical protein J7E97_27650 [Streptomyces sp. ISL-66]|uniref:DUF6328 family protein n=1 Tax=Streptomyces sp. ISL-66 TaxID=2819186 RepID=UPI001BEA600B|nr:DUF6328 family protein [Streptomyces sp. ISL-66]MBT2471537.1 hypothetical protein [Streptomyces sp. ISL-66]
MDARGPGPGDRTETVDERADRLWCELLHEVRVALTGVQLLLAFLLAASFTPAFQELGRLDQYMYVACVLLGAAATGALIAPACVHRLVSGLGVKPETVVWGARLTSAGLCLLLAMVALALLIVLRTVLGAWVALALDGGLLLWFGLCWLVPGLLLRREAIRRASAVPPGGDGYAQPHRAQSPARGGGPRGAVRGAGTRSGLPARPEGGAPLPPVYETVDSPGMGSRSPGRRQQQDRTHGRRPT